MDATAPKKLDTSSLKKFAQAARRTLIEQVSGKLDQVLADGSAAGREQPLAVKELEKEIANDGRDQVIERVAYTWFNRFSARLDEQHAGTSHYKDYRTMRYVLRRSFTSDFDF